MLTEKQKVHNNIKINIIVILSLLELLIAATNGPGLDTVASIILWPADVTTIKVFTTTGKKTFYFLTFKL